MKEIVFVTRRIKINGQQEIVEEFVAEKAKEILGNTWGETTESRGINI